MQPFRSAEKLSMQRFEKRLEHDKFAWVRAEIERQYIRLTKIGVGPGAKTSWYRGARGSGNNNKRRAAILAHAFDGRRIGL
jgi:hypothetical protein